MHAHLAFTFSCSSTRTGAPCCWLTFVRARAAGAAADYALVPDGDGAMRFFCSDWSNEMLVAAGIRNDSNDYFKVSLLGVAEGQKTLNP